MTTAALSRTAREGVMLYFPSRGETLNLEREIQPADREAFRTALYAEQREFQEQRVELEKRVSCSCTDRGRARFIVKRLTREHGTPVLYLARFPNSGPMHAETCFFRDHEVPAPARRGGGKVKPFRTAGRDFAALFREMEDPEHKALPDETNLLQSSSNATSRRRTRKESIGLRSFGTQLLLRSGMCEWKPAFRYSRNHETFDGRIAGALDLLARGDPANKVARFVQALPEGVPILRWSTIPARQLGAVTKCIGFGFVNSLGRPTETGARELRLRARPGGTVPATLLIPRSVLANAAKNPESPLGPDQQLDHPIWVIFVAQRFGPDWKIHELAGFRVTRVGAIPVCSPKEEAMATRLIAEHRVFRRCLVSPAEIRGRGFIPDFQLLDTLVQEYIEVAGRMDDPAYERTMAAKKSALGAALLIWDTRRSLAKFVLPLRRLRGPARAVKMRPFLAPANQAIDPVSPD